MNGEAVQLKENMVIRTWRVKAEMVADDGRNWTIIKLFILHLVLKNVNRRGEP